MSGRDVRRVAARASTSAHMEKQNIVTRLVVGALSQGVDEVYLAKEPFRISIRAVENLPEQDRLTVLEFPVTHSDTDTEVIAEQMWEAGCRVFVVLGGDGTSRIVARTLPDAAILPVSTGTNNVFPQFVDASVAGTAAGIIATGKIDYQDNCRRCKRIHISTGQIEDIALIDAVLLRGDQIGSLLPFDAAHIRSVFLTRAEPAAVGISPIGGYLMPCEQQDDFAVRLTCGEPPIHRINVPISPGLYTSVSVASVESIDLGTKYTISGPGILAFDGDRRICLLENDRANITVSRDGPFIIQPRQVLHQAAARRLMSQPV
jgi:hypothetical protein